MPGGNIWRGELAVDPVARAEEARRAIQGAAKLVRAKLEQKGAITLPEFMSWPFAAMRAERSK
eukprot:4841380-Pyramimonas_sp.AAC.1